MKRGFENVESQDAGESEQPLPKRIQLIPSAISKQDGVVKKPVVSTTDSPASVKDTQKHRSQTLLGILENEVIRENITSQLDLKDYLKLEKYSLDLEELLTTRWNMNGRLRHFAAPEPLRQVMAISGAIVAGFFPLQFFENTTWLHIGLDFFVMSGDNADQLKQHLLSEGYKVTNTIELGAKNKSTVLKTITYCRKNDEFGTTIIQVAETSAAPFLGVLHSAQYTADITIMTWDQLYAPFAYETHLEHRLYAVNKLSDNSGARLAEYCKLGWSLTNLVTLSPTSPGKFENILTGIGFSNAQFLKHSRCLANANALSIIIDEMEEPENAQSSFIIACAWWEFIEQRVGVKQPYLKMSAYGFSHPLLRYDYIMANHSGTQFDYVKQRLDRLLPFELAKLGPEDRPKNVLRIANANSGELVMDEADASWRKKPKPETWTFLSGNLTLLLYIGLEMVKLREEGATGDGDE
ncbi:hypothetical protein BDV97DRAFT_389535 [Delphinella strobiligena]|nr:hypothetical protein BDV97DRAFT_389535 [Delphinella strobiligena]